MMQRGYNSGVSVVEVVVGTSVLTALVLVLLGAFHVFLQATGDTLRATKAEYLAEEGIEAVRAIRDEGWVGNFDALAIDTDLYLDFTGSAWQTTATPEVIDDIYNRNFVLRSVRRDSNDDIVTSGGTVDAGSRFIEVHVSWPGRGTTMEAVIKGYLMSLNE